MMADPNDDGSVPTTEQQGTEPETTGVQESAAVNSEAYWAERFRTNWRERGGSEQTLFFYRTLLDYLPPWFMLTARQRKWSICDWGCGLGEGSDLLAHTFPGPVTGIDFAAPAIEDATQRYGRPRFIATDLMTTDHDDAYNVVLSSNTLEHFSNPRIVLDRIATFASDALVIMVPFREYQRHEEHETTFDPASIPAQVARGRFVLAASRVIPTDKMEPTYWWGEQILLIYLTPALLTEADFRLADIVVDRGELGKLESVALTSAQARVAQLEQDLLARTTERQAAQVQFSEREAQLQRDLDAERQAAHDQLAEMQSTLDTVRAETQAQVEELAARETELLRGRDAERETAQAQFAAVQSTLDTVQTEIDAARAQILELRAREEQLSEAVAVAQAQAFSERTAHEALAAEAARRKGRWLWGSIGSDRGFKGRETRGQARSRFLRESINQYGLGWTLRWLVQRLVKGRQKPASRSLRAASPQADAEDGIGGGPSPLFAQEVAIFTGLPPWDIGGGQRAAQLARSFARAGYRVRHVALFDAVNASTGAIETRPADARASLHPLVVASRATGQDPRDFFEAAPVALCVFELPHPDFEPYLAEAKRRGIRTVFEWIDPWDGELGRGWFSKDMLATFVRDADSVTATARSLQAAAVAHGRSDTLYLPNAGDEAIFDRDHTWERPGDLPVGRRTALYVGSLYGSWIDWELIAGAAANAPDLALTFIGDPPPDAIKAPNIHYLGSRPIDAVPAYLAHCDCAIIPFRVNALTAAVNPIKLHEYALMGAPIVATDMPELELYPEAVRARSQAAFVRALKVPPKAPDVARSIMRHSWGARAAALLSPPQQARIAAVILIHDNADVIELCLDSLLMHGVSRLSEIIVVDNVSSDAGPSLARARQGGAVPLTVLSNPVNGCSSGRNLALDHIGEGSDFVLFLDSDQWLSNPLGLDEATAILDAHPPLTAIGWIAAQFERRGDLLVSQMLPQHPADFLADAKTWGRGYGTAFDYLGSGGLMVRLAAARAARFDERFDPTCFEDADFSRALQAAGGELGYRPLSGICHRAHATTGRMVSETYRKLYARNSALYRSKWESG